MKFKKGTEVEVQEKGDGSSVAWRSARILAGNGHSYVVRYDDCHPDMDLVKSKVPRRFLRPCPPRIKQISCAPGLILEVFENHCWKLAKILGSMGRSMIVVLLLGSMKEIEVSFTNMRAACTWKDGYWIPFLNREPESDGHKNKDLDNSQSNVRILSNRIRPSLVEGRICGGGGQFTGNNSLRRVGKRQRRCMPQDTARDYKIDRKMFDRPQTCYGLIVQHLPEKVGAFVSPERLDGENCMLADLNATTAFFQTEINHQKPIDDADVLVVSDDESVASSVGSCSVTNGFCRSIDQKDNQGKEDCGRYYEAESFCASHKISLTGNEEILAEADKSNLDAYLSFMRSFCASGSINWEQEASLTNLRIACHISNGEHASVLKHLMSRR